MPNDETNKSRALHVLADQVLQAMAARGGVKNFPSHAVLVNEDDESDSIYILLKGKVKVYGAGANGREVVYTTLGPGEYFGEMTLDGGPRSASVMTLEPCTCVVVPGANVRDFLGTHPDFALHLVRKLIGLARRSTDTVKRLALDDVYTRISKLLQELAVEEDGRQVVHTIDAVREGRTGACRLPEDNTPANFSDPECMFPEVTLGILR